jgi:hypothetical protein
MTKRSRTAPIQNHLLETDAHAAAPNFQVESSMSVTPTREIAIIDRGVDDLARLLAGIRPDVGPIHAAVA